MFKKSLVLCALALLSPIGLIAQTPVTLVNPSFQDNGGNTGYFGDIGNSGATFDIGHLAGWSVSATGGSGNYAGNDNNQPIPNLDGDRFGYIGGSGALSVFTRAANRPVAIAGNTYDASFLFRDDTVSNPAPIVSAGSFAIEFFDSGNVFISSTTVSLTLIAATANSDPFQSIAASGVAPAGAAFVGLRLNVGSNIVFDNATLTTTAPIPEPSTYAAIAGLALLGFAGMKRRRS